MTNSRTINWALLAGSVAGLALTTFALRRHSEFSVASKVVLITGGSRGLGLVLARKLGRDGARIVICARTESQLRTAQSELRGLGIEVMAIQCDVTSRVAVRDMIDLVTRKWGAIDVLINNAGVIQMGPLESQTSEDFDLAMRTHFCGPLNTMSEVVPMMREKQSGRIVNIASIGGKVCVPHLVPYCASKFALVGLSEGFAAELAPVGITVTTVCPGLMRTGSHRNALFKGRHQEEYAWFSIPGSMPLFSIGAERAADQIISSMKRGDSHIVVGLPARVAVLLHDLLPDLAVQGYSLVNRLLPSFGGIGRGIARGAQSNSALAPSILTRLNERAALANNELA